MIWSQRTLRLDPRPRGFHLITSEVLQAMPQISEVKAGMLHVFIQHTSASLTINENASPEVRGDLQRHLNELVPEEQPYYEHTLEGPDDMPAHIKASLLGHSVMVPVREGEAAFGTWQGIYLGEHRDRGGARSLLITLQGERF